jgi:cytochrome c553
MNLLVRMTVLMLLTTGNAWAAGDATKGAEIAKTMCMACHAADGNSPTPAFPKLAGQLPEYLVKQLKNFKSGERANAVMGPLASALSDADMQDVSAHFAAQKSKEAGAATNGKGSVGEKIYRAGIADSRVPACSACHGPAGSGLPARFPGLGGQYADYTALQMKAFRSGERANAPMMKVIAARMTDADIAAVSDYIQGLR